MWMQYVLFGVLGAVLGSFSNVLVLRLPHNKALGGRSVCDNCGKTLSLLSLIPVLSAVCSGFRARCCGMKFSSSYTAWELLNAILFCGALFVSQTILEAAPLALSIWVLVCIARIDAATQMIPDILTVGLILSASALAALRGTSPLVAVLLLLFVFGGQWLLSRGKWIGSGDVLLSVGIGILVGHFAYAMLVVLIAYIIGGIAALVLLSRKKTSLKQTVAFGPFLCSAAIIVVFLGDTLLQWTNY